MVEKVKAQMIEIDKTELREGAKYIFLLDPTQISWLNPICESLSELDIKATVLPISKNDLHVYEITDK